MFYFILFLILMAMGGIIKGLWNILFRPIFVWISESIQNMFMSNLGVGKITARALLSIVAIVVIILIFILD